MTFSKRTQHKIAALILAAGASRRMGGPNKLIATFGGKPLVRIAAEAALASRASSVTVVTGHDAAAIQAALAGLPVGFAHNPDHAKGLSTSLSAGLRPLERGPRRRRGDARRHAGDRANGDRPADRGLPPGRGCRDRGAGLCGPARQSGAVGGRASLAISLRSRATPADAS